MDRVILVGVLLTVALAVYAAFARAAGRGSGPIALAGLAAALTALLVVYRVLQEPGVDEVNTVQPGAPIALAILGVIALACAMSLRREDEAAAGEAPGLGEPEPAP
jgi:drug/metabolite transporter (DMT)-like permease